MTDQYGLFLERLIRFLAPFVLIAVSCLALDPSQPASTYLQTTFTVEDGLPSNSVNAIVQTRNGFLWIGTEAGLARFNGRRFALIKFRGSGPSSQGVIRSLAEAENGDLWVGTDTGLGRIPKAALDDIENSHAAFYHPGEGKSDEVRCLRYSHGHGGILWVGTGQGLYRYQNNHFVLVLPKVSISRLEETLDGHLLIISDQGFLEWDGKEMVGHPGLSTQLGVRSDQLFHVLADHKGIEWFCTSGGVAKRVDGTLRRFRPYGKAGDSAFRVTEDTQGNIWVFTQTGIYRAERTDLEPLALGMNAACAYSDREGRLWIGRKGDGLVRFKDRPVRILRPLSGRVTSKPMAVLSSRDGKLWVGNSCGGLSLFDGRNFKTYDEKNGLSNSCIWALAEGANHDLWIGTWGGGLFLFRQGKFTQYASGQGLPSQFIRAIVAAPDASLWIATEDGLSHMQGGQFRTYTTADGLSSDHVVNVYRDHRGGIWAATSKGINYMTGDHFVSLSPAADVADQQYTGLSEDSSGNLYALSAPSGVWRIDNFKLRSVNSELDVLSMLEFERQEFWFPANTGLFRVPANGLRRAERDRQDPIDYARFDRADGLIAPQCSRGVPNMTTTPDGKLWVATAQGLAVIDIRHLPHRNIRQAIFADEVTVGRTMRSAGHELVLPPGTHHMEIRFDAVELGSPEKVRFQYRLDDVDADWLNADKTRTAVYTSIPPGIHLFHFRACNSDGVWDQAGSTYTVIQRPYYYETNIFRIGCSTLLVVVLTGIYFLRLRQVTLQVRSRLEERLDERERIARDLHDTLLQSVQGLILRFQAIATQIPPAEPARQMMEECLGRADQVLIEGRDRVTTLRVQAERSGDLVQALAKASEEIGRTSTIEFSVIEGGSPQALHPVVRDEAYWIGREALLNALYHSRAQKVETEVIYSGGALKLLFRDDGKGIDPEVLQSGARPEHWGLVGMRERAEKIGAHLAIHSRAGAGTEVELVIPASIAYGGQLNGSGWKWIRQLRVAGRY